MITPISDILELMTPEIIPTVEGIASPFILHRYDKGSARYYFDLQGEAPKGYLSVTEFCALQLPTGYGLQKWMMDVGEDYAKHYANQRAAYGTLLHIELIDIMRSGKGSFDEVSQRAFTTASMEGYKYAASQWASDIVNDIASFLLFMNEKEVEIISAEFPIASDEYQLAGCIDIVCSLKFGKGRVNAILDIKSGRKGFYESHELQLHAYKTLWNDLFENYLPITHVFNVAPQSIKNKTKYKLENQTDSKFANTVRMKMIANLLEGNVAPPMNHFDITGDFTIGSFELENHYLARDFKNAN